MRREFEDQAVFPGSELELIREFMLVEGISAERWLLGSGLCLDELKATQKAISLKQFDVIYRNVYRLVARPSVGIDFGLALNLSRWGMLSAALLCANTLGHALSIADDYREILRSRFLMRTHIEADYMRVALSPKPGMGYPVNEVFAYEVLLGTLKTQISQLTAKPFRFKELKLPYAKPLHHVAYQKLVEVGPVYEARQGEFVLPLALVNQPLPMANRVTRANVLLQCRKELERIRHARAGDIAFSVRGFLSQSALPVPALDEVAQALSMSPRTLRRRLQQAGLQYSLLCDQHRQQSAMQLMPDVDLSLSEIARRVGFKEVASFHKAFKRWTGETPARYRAHLPMC